MFMCVYHSLYTVYSVLYTTFRYRQSLDPTVEEVRRLATGLRRAAREER